MIDGIYRAGFGEISWDTAVQPLRDFTRCSAIGIHVDDLRLQRAVIVSSPGLDPEETEKYEQYYVTKNPWMLRSAPFCSSGKLLFGDQFVSQRELKRTEYYNDWLRPNNIARSMAVCLHHRPDVFSLFSLLLPPGAGDFKPRDIELLRLLIPHLQRATRARQIMHRYHSEKSLAEYTLDALPCGAALLNRESKVVLMNRGMQQILAREDGVFIRHLKLRFLQPSAQKAFESMLTRTGPDAVGDVFRVMRASPPADYEIVVTPVPRANDSNPMFDVTVDQAAWLVLVTDPDQRTHGHLALLQRLYAFSRAEAEITSLLVDGKSLREITEIRRTTINTVKSQVRAIYRKLDVTSRASLVRRMSKLETGIRLGTSAGSPPLRVSCNRPAKPSSPTKE